ncbi:hypothetical protein BGZ81_005185, partial [Podila clonocystis]
TPAGANYFETGSFLLPGKTIKEPKINVWDKDVSRIYQEILKEDEPAYGKQPKTDELLDETGQKKKKYIN